MLLALGIYIYTVYRCFISCYINIMVVISSFWLLITLVLATAYITLFERYIMATVQRRVGPDYILFGIIQPLLDGIKLLANDYMSVYRVWDSIYFFFVIVLLMFGVISWSLYCFDSWSYMIFLGLSILWLLVCASLGVYTTILSGLSGSCRFGVLGVYRFVFQLLSYEINFSVVILILSCYVLGLSVMSVLSIARLHVPLLLYLWLFVYLVILGMIETARVPFDMPESESELVSGYSTEYSSFLFALLFLGEYGALFVYAGFVIVALGGSLSVTVKLLLVVTVAAGICAVRCIYARLRYTTIIVLGWLHLIWLSLCTFTLLCAVLAI